MNIDSHSLENSLLLFSKKNNNIFWTGQFVSLSTDLGQGQQCNNFKRVGQLVGFIVKDIGNISTIIHRLSWFRNAQIDDEFRKCMWFDYAKLDVEHFHVELRSIMDYIGEIISIMAEKRGQVPNSFNDLINYVKKNNGNRARLGEELSTIIESACWFPSLRGVRDSLVHVGGSTLIFDIPEEAVLFQIYNGELHDLVDLKVLMYNENVAHFDRYAAFYLSNIFVFLEKIAKYIYQKNEIVRIGIGDSNISSPGFYIIHDWIIKLNNILKNG